MVNMINSNNASVSKYLMNSAALGMGTYMLSKVNWLKGPLTAPGLTILTGVNALALTGASMSNSRNEENISSLKRIAVNIAALIAGGSLLVALKRPVALYTNYTVKTYTIAQLATFHIAVKAAIYGVYKITSSFFFLRGLKNIGRQEIACPNQLGAYKAYFESNPEKWNTLNLNRQAYFNEELTRHEQDILAFTSEKLDGKLTNEELEVYRQFVEKNPNKERLEILFSPQLSVDLKKITSFNQIGVYKAYFESHLDEWRALNLNEQARFNYELKKNKEEILAFTSEEVDGKLTNEEFRTYRKFVERYPNKARLGILFSQLGTNIDLKKVSSQQLLEILLRQMDTSIVLVRVCKAYFKSHPDEWNTLNLTEQARFNHELTKNGKVILAFTSEKVSGELTNEQLESYRQFVEKNPNKARLTVLFNQLDNNGIAKLSRNQLLKYHRLLTNECFNPDQPCKEAFAKAFYNNDFPPPTKAFYFDIKTPSSADDILIHQVEYYVNYYSQTQNAFSQLSSAEQDVISRIFARKFHQRPITSLSEKDLLQKLQKNELEFLNALYRVNPGFWGAKSDHYQRQFNNALEVNHLEKLTLTKRRRFLFF